MDGGLGTAHGDERVAVHGRDRGDVEVAQASTKGRRPGERPLHRHLLVEQHADEQRRTVGVQQLVGGRVTGDVQVSDHGATLAVTPVCRCGARTLPAVLAAVVLTYDAPPGMLADCLQALRRHSPADLALIVVDNGHHVRRMSAAVLDGLDVIETGRNLGFAGGMNVGIRRALARGATAVAVLNDDVMVEAGWLPPLIAELDSDPKVGAVQPKLVFPGTPRRVNSMGVQLGRDGAGTDIDMGVIDDGIVAPRDLELFTGGAVLLRTEFLADVGVFDDRYFLYYEDVDLGLRGRQHGWHYRCAPASCVVHAGSATTSRVGSRTAYLRERNRLWVLFRHRPAGDIARGVWLSVRRLRWAPRWVHARALVAGLASAPRLLAHRWRHRRA